MRFLLPTRNAGLLTSQGPGGALVRRLLPAVLVGSVLIGVLRWLGQAHGLYGTKTGVALMSGAALGGLAWLLWYFGRWLDRDDLERRRMEGELGRSGRYVELTRDMVCTANFEGYYEQLNASWSQALGWSEEELRSRPFLEFVHPEDREETVRVAGALGEGGMTVDFLNRYQTKDGGWRWLDWSAIGVPEEGLIYASARDVTERKLTERYVEAQHEATRVLAEATTTAEALPALLRAIGERMGWPVAAFWTSTGAGPVADLRCTAFWQEPGTGFEEYAAATRALSLTPGDGLPGRAWESRQPRWVPDVSVEAASHRSQAAGADGLHACVLLPILSGSTVLGVVELLSDEVRPAEPDLLEILDTLSGQLAQFLERRRSEAAREAIERQTRQIIDTAHDAFIAIDSSGRITDWNPQAEAIFGRTSEEAVGRDLADTIIPEEHREAHRRGIEHFHATGEGPVLGRLIELPALHRDGHEFPAELTISALETESGHSFNAFLRDITERKGTQEELVLARDQALDASRQKSEFLANMSHEIRTPMNGVVGMTELLLETELTPEQQQYAQLARTSSEALVAVVNDILDLSKIEAGKLEIDRADFRLGELVEDVCELLAPVALEKGLEFSTFVESDLPPVVQGDEVRVRQVLLNLVANAVKFTAEGEVNVHALLDDAHGPAGVRFEIKDSGIGIDPGHLDRLFESFSQADTSTTRRFGGTGLGLTITKQLTEMMGGEISVTSEPGRGSTFTATLPLEPSTVAADEVEAFEPRSDLESVRVIVADDNPTNRFIFAHHTTAWGMEVTTAADGKQAITRMRQAADRGQPFQVALVDMRMPELDGIALAREVRADPALSSTPLLLLSSSFDDRHAARAAGIDMQLPKPVRREKLFDALVSIVRPDRSPTPVRPRRQSAGNGRRPVVLVAEDNAVNQMVATRFLEKRGIDVRLATNGREAVNALMTDTFDLVLMDCQMPEMDGYEATKEIRRAEGGQRHTPIVAMTAHSMQGDRDRCLAVGMDDYLSKPLDTRAFDGALSRWVGDLGQTEEAVAPEQAAVAEVGSSEGGVDPAALERLREQIASGDALEHIVALFRSQTPEKLEKLGASVGSGDRKAVTEAAHFLKGSAASLGAVRMAELCQQLETNSPARSPELLEALNGAFDEAVFALEGRLGPSGDESGSHGH